MALVRDPAFWRRFSVAVRLDEEVKTSPEDKNTIIWSNNWIRTQHREKRKSILWGCALLLAALVLITVVVVIIWWFDRHHWLRKKHD
ncbi:hypothetical protein P175DRAFT_0557064 [Aspergillus ochraceoroseus IBT 24754]|uniref:Uncharacterized protein n=3 Tax=Aspergillus subgen. Nidulantes TaxID=2720870 RepID=A0A0F8XDF4_9EURO|nr:uncharacterized protein P175DRAFT_0557064 [Aspergillus ochraceoroseus IBT 24754]KKK14646.1 hypothetical protein AOCH_005782 [Aspergillus ochraceoroseus]KKK21617.1 hypothetical protein ARAM_006735 [Aspergillus rambellii]PTU22138.1 hypothetical protein P175DRAFT_0557064 [Aspergillus ochraceoroseus IBT 24754]